MNREVIGHNSQRLILKRLIERNRLPQALMFAGITGIGKKLTALEFARTLFCSNRPYGGCNNCSNCHLFDIGNLPDLLQFDCRDRETTNTESIRTLLYELNLKSFSGHRIIVIDNAEEMNTQSANILLKSVEEPRPGTHFLLISANPYRLPATLLSRCHLLFFNQLSNSEVLEILSKNKETLESLNIIRPDLSLQDWCHLADGSFDNLTELSAHADQWSEMKEALNFIACGDIASALELSEKLAKDKGNLRALLKLLQLEARTRMISGLNNGSAEMWSTLLTNLLAADYFIHERNISAAYLLRDIFINLNPAQTSPSFTGISEDARLLESFLR